MKRQDRLCRGFQPGRLENLEMRALLTMSPTAQLPNMNVAVGATVATVDLTDYFKDNQATSDYAIITTSLGTNPSLATSSSLNTIPVLLTPKTTPLTVANFLNNVDKGKYADTLVDRSVAGSTWQAGGYQVGANSGISATAAGSEVKSEAGAPNVRGTIAMTESSTPGESDANRFFFNETDNTNSATSGATVFGRVVSPQGLAAMDAISAVPVPASSPLGANLAQAPLQYYSPGQAVQGYNLTKIDSITKADSYFVATSDNPNIVTATISDGEMTINPVSDGTAHIEVDAYGSDGTPAVESFTVNVFGGLTTTPTPTAPVEPVSSPAPLPTPVTPESALVPAASGVLPASAVAGEKTKIRETVTLTSPSVAFSQEERVSLSLSKTGATADYSIASTKSMIKLKQYQQTKLSLSASKIPSTVPAGTYHLLATVTDPDGDETTVDTGKMLVVQAAPPKAVAK